MKSFVKPVEAPIASEGGVRSQVAPPEDPYRALEELMVAVEALCPRWPERPTFPPGGRFLL